MLHLRNVHCWTPTVLKIRKLSISKSAFQLKYETGKITSVFSLSKRFADLNFVRNEKDGSQNEYKKLKKAFGIVVAFGLSGIVLKKAVSEKEDSLLPATIFSERYLIHAQEQLFENTGDTKKTSSHLPTQNSSIKDNTLPDHIQYLLIGGGTASVSAYRAIKAIDPKAKILIIGEENRYPYMRPPLSKELWFGRIGNLVDGPEIKFDQWNGRDRSLFFEKEQFYTPIEKLMSRENGGISILKGHKVKKIDTESQIATIDDGRQIRFDKCLVATGGYPKRLKEFEKVESKVSYFRNIDDLFKLVEISKKAQSIAVVGGGFLGSELSCALSSWAPNADLKVTQIFPDQGLLSKVLPEYLSKWATNKVQSEGVNILSNTSIVGARIDPQSDKLVISTSDGKEVIADHAIIAVGLDPESELGKASGLEIDGNLGGYKVNDELQSRKNIWVAGDTASFPDPLCGQRVLQHHDNAVLTGRVAGENMAGGQKKMNQQSMFWSDLGAEIAFEGIGYIDSELKTFGVFAQSFDSSQFKLDDDGKPMVNTSPVPSDENFGRGVIFYLRDDIIVGVLLWNIFNHMSVAKKVIREQKKFEDLTEVARLFPIYPQETPSETQ